MAEIRSAGPKMRPMGGPGGFNQRPAPYDRGDRFGGMNRYGGNMGPMSRPSRNFKGILYSQFKIHIHTALKDYRQLIT